MVASNNGDHWAMIRRNTYQSEGEQYSWIPFFVFTYRSFNTDGV